MKLWIQNAFSLIFWVVLSFYLIFSYCAEIKAQDNNNFSVVLGQQETTYAYKGEKENRASNVELAASRINGTILQPNEVFSYNKLVGNRTYQNGFKDAPVIISGDLVDGIGGGVCQVSGTTHAAMLYSGMIIIESKQHSRHSLYIDPGLDSTVAWPTLDLKMQNNYPFPVKIIAETSRDKKRGHLLVKIMGKKQMFKTEVIKDIHKKVKYKTRKIIRNDLPKGFRKVVEPGTYDVTMTRIRHVYRLDTNQLIIDESLKLHYKKSERILIIGTKERH